MHVVALMTFLTESVEPAEPPACLRWGYGCCRGGGFDCCWSGCADRGGRITDGADHVWAAEQDGPKFGPVTGGAEGSDS